MKEKNATAVKMSARISCMILNLTCDLQCQSAYKRALAQSWCRALASSRGLAAGGMLASQRRREASPYPDPCGFSDIPSALEVSCAWRVVPLIY